MKAPSRSTVGLSELTKELHYSQWLISSIWGKSGAGMRSIPTLLILIWISLERLRREVQASARVDDWQSSEAATQAKGRELGIEARPKEGWAEYRARIASAMNAGGR